VYKKHKFSEEVEQDIVARYLSGESTVVLGRAYGVDKKMIRSILVRRQVERRKTGEFPLRSHAKLYHFGPEVLREMVEGGMSLREIGHKLGMASSAVLNACVSFDIPLKDREEQFLAKRRRQIPDSLFSPPLNAQESWLLGLLMTDGCVMERTLIKLSISDKDGTQLASQIIGFGSVRESSPEIREYNGKIIHGRLPVWNYVACSIQLVERLEAFGLTARKTKTLTFPNVLDIALPDFIRGLWDGDGSWFVDKRDNSLIAHFGCASEPFMHALQAITSNITGSRAQVRSNSRKDFWQLSYQTKPAVALARWLYYDAGLVCLERKHAIVRPFL
jgi:transposase-like protein